MCTEQRWSHEARFDSVALSTPEARDFVCGHLVEHDLLYLIEDVRLVVSELVTNAIMHARSRLTVTLEELPSCVRLTVHDDSPYPPVRVLADLDATGGRGMDLVDQFCTSWGILSGTDGDKSVWASFALRPVLMGAKSTLG